MIKYKKFQFGWAISSILLIVIIWITLAYIYKWGNNPITETGYIIFLILFVTFLLGFYGMTVIVTDKFIKIVFGIGIYSKKIDISTIDSISVQKCPIYYGYGIRLIPNGWLYNVSGRYAIEIKRVNKNGVIQIGTNDWDNLKNFIADRLSDTRK